jgi:hypothetical protein
MVDESSFIPEIFRIDQLLLVHNFKGKERILLIQDCSHLLLRVVDYLTNILNDHIVLIHWLYQEQPITLLFLWLVDLWVPNHCLHSNLKEDLIIPAMDVVLFPSSHAESSFIRSETTWPTYAFLILATCQTWTPCAFYLAQLRIAQAIFVTELPILTAFTIAAIFLVCQFLLIIEVMLTRNIYLMW